MYYNYKGYSSFILLTLVDADYKFLWVDVVVNSATSDCSTFNQSRLKTALDNDELGFPGPEPLPADDHDTPYFFIGDNAFPLQSCIINGEMANGHHYHHIITHWISIKGFHTIV